MFVNVMSNLVEFFFSVRLLFRREEEEMTSQTAVQMFVVVDGCDFGVVLFTVAQNRMIGLATVISVEDVKSDLLTK